MQNEIEAADAYRQVAQQQVEQARARVAVAEQRIRIAGLQAQYASENLAFLNGREFSSAMWYDLAREARRVARRYIVCIEYFSDKTEEITYRGHRGMLFKRDFGGFWLDNFPDLEVRDYAFAWKRATGLNNLTWWLFEKRG